MTSSSIPATENAETIVSARATRGNSKTRKEKQRIMMQSARALPALRTSGKTIVFRRRGSVDPKLAFVASVFGFLGLLVVILTHIGTYDTSLIALSMQQERLTSAAPVVHATTHNASLVKTMPTLASGGNTSRALQRISQLDCSQYASESECSTWAYSACSTAALTEVINSYGYHYRITDILQQEVAANAITPALGLLDDQGIQRTVARFGFTTQSGYTLSLDQVIATANSGHPVVVGWPPAKYDGGHLVVVIGGDSATVQLADSSRYNRQLLTRSQFLTWWAGFSAVIQPGMYSFLGKPTLSASFINQVLASYGSPAAGKGQTLYNDGVKYGIDPAYALAFFMHESTFGTAGEARTTLALGNERCIQDRPCIDQDRGGYAQMHSWEDGFEHWYRLIRDGYMYGQITNGIAGHPCLTIDQTIPIYAPSSDNNDVASYIAALKHELHTWWSGTFRVA